MQYSHNLKMLTIATSSHVQLKNYTKPGMNVETSVMPKKEMHTNDMKTLPAY